ncbi:hypothetical protein BsWGS_24362 [Bradybaena similaris]
MKFILVLMLALAVASGKPAAESEQQQVVAVAQCPQIMCMIYCPTGHKIDANGCTLCDCNDFVTIILP